MSVDRRSLGAVLFLPALLLLMLGAMRDKPIDLEPLEQLYGGPLPAALADLIAKNPRALQVIAESEGLLASIARMVEATEEWRDEYGPGVIVLRSDSWGDRAILARERPNTIVVHTRDPFFADDPLEYDLDEYLEAKAISGLWDREWEAFERRVGELAGVERGLYTFYTPEGASEEPPVEEDLPPILAGTGSSIAEQLHDSFTEGDASEAQSEMLQYFVGRERSHHARMGASRVFEQTLRLTDRLHPENLPEARARAALFVNWFFDRETPVDPPFTTAELDGLDLGD